MDRKGVGPLPIRNERQARGFYAPARCVFVCVRVGNLQPKGRPYYWGLPIWTHTQIALRNEKGTRKNSQMNRARRQLNEQQHCRGGRMCESFYYPMTVDPEDERASDIFEDHFDCVARAIALGLSWGYPRDVGPREFYLRALGTGVRRGLLIRLLGDMANWRFAPCGCTEKLPRFNGGFPRVPCANKGKYIQMTVSVKVSLFNI